MTDQPWVEKYKPLQISDLVGNKKAVSKIAEWLNKWPKAIVRNQRALLLFGPAGVGKTIVVYTIANELGFEVFEINSSVKRSKKMMNELLKTSTKTFIFLYLSVNERLDYPSMSQFLFNFHDSLHDTEFVTIPNRESIY